MNEADLKIKILTELGKLNELARKFGEIEDKTKQVERETKNLQNTGKGAFNDLDKGAQGFGARLSGLQKAAIAVGVALAALAVAGTIKFLKDSIKASAEQEAIFNKLAQAIENTGVAYASVEDDIQKTFRAIQNVTKFGDEEQAGVLQTLITLTGDYKTSLKALELVLDASVALHQDANTTALLFGKALTGNATQLTRYGIVLDDATQALLKNADAAESLDIITKALGDKFKGLAESEGASFEGRLISLSNAWGDLKQAVGDFITTSPVLANVIIDLRDKIQEWEDALKSNEELQKRFEDGLKNAAAAVEGLVKAIALLVEQGLKLNNWLAQAGQRLGQFIADLELKQRPIVDAVERIDFNALTQDQDKLIQSLDEVGFAFELNAQEIQKTNLETDRYNIKIPEATAHTSNHQKAVSGAAKAVKELTINQKDANDLIKQFASIFPSLNAAFRDYGDLLNVINSEVAKVPNRFQEAWAESIKWREELFKTREELGALSVEGEVGQNLDSFATFVGSTFANIGQDIGRAIVQAGDVWDAVLNSMKNALANLLGFIIANPIQAAFSGGQQGGGILGGIGNIFSSGIQGIGNIFSGVGGFFSNLSQAIPLIGTAISVLTVGITSIIDLFKKAPEVHVDIGRFNKSLDDRLATVSDFIELSDDVNSALAKDLVQIRKGKIGIDNTELREIIFGKITDFISSLQDLLLTLPKDIGDQLNESLLSTQLIDFDELTKRIIGLDFTGKDAGKQLEAFLQSGSLEAQFEASITPFFDELFTTLGVLPEVSQKLIDDFIEKLKAVPKGENRQAEIAAVGAEFSAQVNALIAAFNFINRDESIDETTRQLEIFARTLGFDVIPSIEEVKDRLREMIEAGNIDPEAVNNMIALGQAVGQLDQSVEELADTAQRASLAINQSISSLVGLINNLNSQIISLGGAGIDVSGALQTSIGSLQTMLDNQDLSLDERELILNELNNEVNQLVSSQLEAQQAAQRQAQADLQADNARREATISSLNREKDLIQSNARARLDSLREELRLSEALSDLALDIQRNIRELTISQAAGTPFQRLATAQNEIQSLFKRLQVATDEEKLTIGKDLQSLLNELITIGGEGFLQADPEFRAIFNSVLGELEKLQGMVGPTRSVEEISAEIARIEAESERSLASIDARIEQLRSESQRSIAIQTQLQGEAAAQARQYYEFIRQQALALLNARLEELAKRQSETTLTEAQLLTENNFTLVQIRDILASQGTGNPVIAAQHGFRGFLVGENGPELITIDSLKGRSGGGAQISIDNRVIVNGNVDSTERVKELEQIAEKQADRILSRFESDLLFGSLNRRLGDSLRK